MSDVVLKRHCKLQSFFYNYNDNALSNLKSFGLPYEIKNK